MRRKSKSDAGLGPIEKTFRIASLLLAVFVSVILVAFVFIAHDLERTSQQERTAARLISTALALQANVLTIESAHRGYQITNDDKFLVSIDNYEESIDTRLMRLKTLTKNDSVQRSRTDSLDKQIRSFIYDYARPLSHEISNINSETDKRIYTREGQRRTSELRAAFDQFLTTEVARRNDRTAKTRDLTRRTQVLSIAAAGTILLALLLMTAFVSRNVVSPLRELRDVVIRIALGDFTARPSRSYKGEALELARSIDSMAHDLETAQRILENRAAQIEEHASALERSNEDLEQFAYAAAHDLQEPLRKVASYTTLLARRYEGQLDDDADEFIKHAVSGTQRMQRLINDLLTYSRVNASPQTNEAVLLTEITAEALENLESRIDEREIEIKVNVPHNLSVYGQRGLLIMLFQNLIGNALRFAKPNNPRVVISAYQEDDRVMVSVDDDGPGVSVEHRERVFRIFQRLGAKDQHAGTGIGLALCRRIVERNGGVIAVTESPFGGARFVFDIPAASATE